MLESFLNNVADLQACNFINKRLQHRCFPINNVKFLKATFYIRTPLEIVSVFWTIKILNFNRSLENLPTMDDFNFNNFLSNRLMGGAGYCCSSYYCFCKFTFGNLISENGCFCLFPPLWKTPVTAAFAKLFQKTSSRKSY